MARPHLLQPLLLGFLLQTAAGLAVTATSSWSNDGSKPAVSADSNKQITAVLNTLGDIISSIQADEKKETASYNAYMKWCTSEGERVEEARNDAEDDNERSDLRGKELNSTIAHSQRALEELAQSIREAKDVIIKAGNVRKKENEEYADDVQLNRESLSQVTKAIKIVGKVHGQGGFLQHGTLQRVRLNEPGESSYVLGIMKGLKLKLEKARKKLDAEETGKATMHANFLKVKQAALKNFQEESINKNGLLTESKIKFIRAQKIEETSAEDIAEAEMVLEEVQGQCMAKKESWKTRQTDRHHEIAALQDAINAVKFSTKKLLLAQQQAEDEDHVASDADVLPPPPAFVQMHRAAYRAVRSASGAASDADSDENKEDFAGPKAAVKKLIGVLVKEQKEEDAKYKYCKAEIAKKNKEKEAITGESKELATGANSKTTEIAALGQQVEKLQDEVKKLEKGRLDAFNTRQKERSDYEAGSKERKLAAKVLHQAVQVLEKFYATTDKTALLRLTKATPPPTWSESSRKETRSMTVVQMIEKVADEILEDEKKAADAEAAAVAKFKKFYADSLDEIDKLNAKIGECKASKARMGVQLNSDKEADATKKGDLNTVKAQLIALHKECDDLQKKYEARTKARTFEMNQLKDVIEILSGSKIAARTGLLQGIAALAGNDQEAALIRELTGDGASM